MHIVTDILWALFYFINIAVALYFIVPVLLFLLHYLTGGSRNVLNAYKQENDTTFDFAAVITAHQDTKCIPPLVDSFVKQNYRNFIVYVIADDCETDNLVFDDDRIVVIKPQPAFHAKIRSIKFAVDNFKRKHDVIVIFDSDNLVHPDYFKHLNAYFQRGFKVVQTHMLSKNIDNTYAKLDSIGHIYNTFLERQVKMELGMSSAILGLGIALDLDLYKEIMYKDGLGGFDKKLQVQMAKKVKQIAFAENAIVYDEKVEDGATLEKQRTRWINTYFKYFKDSWSLFLNGFKTFNMGRILLGFVMLRPPLFLTVGSAFALLIAAIFIKPAVALSWLVVLLLFALNFILIIATQSKQKGVFGAVVHIPKVVLRQIRSLLKIKTAGKSFLKTEHQKIIYIDELMKNELS
jgi:cellulose synthase/poly-beta-1,6-N-acetylglucosamine synthase-like glycosyltransferase